MKGDVGKIHYPGRANQVIDYTGLKYMKTATPSNLDGFMELRGRLFVLLEYKHSTAQAISFGQQMLIERTTDALHGNGRFSLGVIAQHDAPCSEEINGAESKALTVRWNGEWKDLRESDFTVKQCIDRAFSYAFDGQPF